MNNKKQASIEAAIAYHERQAKLNAGKEKSARSRRIEHERTASLLREML